MIIEKQGNLLEATDIDILCHQANLYVTWGPVIAAQLKEKYPTAFAADAATKRGDKNKLGTYSYAQVTDKLIVASCYSQDGFSSASQPCATDYKAVKKVFTKLKQDFPGKTIGVPYKYGCGMAGGDWNIVLGIFNELFANDGKLIIYKFVAN